MESHEQGTNLSYNWVVLNTLMKMRDAKSSGNLDSYWINFEILLKMLIPHLRNDYKIVIEKNYTKLTDEIKKISSSQTNQHEQAEQIRNLKTGFADAHMGYIFGAFGNVGIIMVQTEGILEFNEHSIDTIAEIVRTSGGLPSTLKEVTEGA